MAEKKEYIEKNIAIRTAENQCVDGKMWGNEEAETLINAYSLIDDLYDIPSSDVVEVVRCKDCKYWQDNNGGYPHSECRWGHEETPDAEDFCSFGEQREGERE